METLVTGATGLLGRHLIPALQERGHVVRALVPLGEDTSWLDTSHVVVHRGDVRHPDAVDISMRGVDAVIHMAATIGAWRSMEAYHEVNVAGTENVCRVALTSGVQRLVHVSTTSVYRQGLGKPVREDFPLAPLHDPYPTTKAQADRLVQRMIAERSLRAVIVRPSTVVGPSDQLNFGRIASRLRAGKGIIIGSGRNAVSFVYVTDVVQGLLLALEHPRAVGQAFNITSDETMTEEEFLRAIAEDVGGRAPRIRVPYRALYTAAYVAEWIAGVTRSQRPPVVTRFGVALFGSDNRYSIDKACRELGYAPEVPLREAIRKTATAYLQTHMIRPMIERPATS